MDAENGLLVCHLGAGVWRFDANMLPTHLVHADVPTSITWTTALSAAPTAKPSTSPKRYRAIFWQPVPIAGKLMYGLQQRS